MLAETAAAEATHRDGSVSWSGWPDVEAYRCRRTVRSARTAWERRVTRARWARNLGLALCTAAVAGLALPGIDDLVCLGAAVAGCVLVAVASRAVRRLELSELRSTASETLMCCEGYAVSPAAIYVAIHAGSNDARVVRTPMSLVAGVRTHGHDGGSGDLDLMVGKGRVRFHALPDPDLVASLIEPGCETPSSVIRTMSGR